MCVAVAVVLSKKLSTCGDIGGLPLRRTSIANV